jgi:hypothetical protein
MEYLTRDELSAIRSSVTMLDVLRARKATSDRSETALRAYWEAAKRMGDLPPTEKGETPAAFEAFLGRMRAEDFTAITEAPAPLGDGGGTEPPSSENSDTPPESS